MPREVLDFGLAVSPDFPPGTAFEYSNSNFILLGMVIRQVARKPIGALLRERIIAPLKLKGTVWPAGSAALPAPHAQGYTLQGQSSDKPVDATDWTTSAEWTAGELISTVEDLLVYGRATATGRGLLPRKQQRERLDSFNPRIPPESPTLSYGIGLVNDNGWIGHTGDVPGFTTAVYHHRDIGTTVVVEANSDIYSGACRAQETLAPDPISRPCAGPADRIMGAVARSLGRPYRLPPG
jgi:D-alanyl-D-alanine carboxypeptidase